MLRVLRRLFRPKKKEVTREWRKLHNEELNDLDFSPTIVRVMKKRNMKWAGHVDYMGRGRVCRGFWWRNMRGRDHWGDSDVDGRIILMRILRKWNVRLWIRLRVGSG
jgi:hypothetical protein